MSDSEDDFLSADEGSDSEDITSSKNEDAEDIPASNQIPVENPTTNPGDSQINITSSGDVSDSAAVKTHVEHTQKSSEASHIKDVLISDAEESEIKHKNNEDDIDTDNNVIKDILISDAGESEIKHKYDLDEIDAENNSIKDSKLEEGSAQDLKSEITIVDSFKKIEVASEIEENKNESNSPAELSKLKADLDFKNELTKNENTQDKCLDKSDHIKTNQNENVSNISDNIHEGKDVSTNSLKVSDNEGNSIPKLPSVNDASIPKPIKTSKIGAKKDREKLKGKMGAKKLGSKVTKKTLESVEYNKEKVITEISEEKIIIEEVPQEEHSGFTCEQNIVKEKRKEDEKIKQDSWDEQESRWQELQGITAAPLKPSSQSQEVEESGWGGWGNWGSSLISAVGTLSQEVGRGVGTVIETVEGGLGVPDPQTLAKELASERQIKEARLENNLEQKVEELHIQNDIDAAGSSFKGTENENENENEKPETQEDNFSLTSMTGLSTNSFGGFSMFMSGASKVFETASNTVLLGGLDTLELIGQSAMETIQKGDPGLRNKRAFLIEETPNLAHTLAEARQCAASKDEQKLIDHKPEKPTLYQAWENTEGPIHLEALFLVSKQCQGKTSKLLQTLPPHSLTSLTNSNADISKCCEISDENLVDEGSDFFSLLGSIAEGKGLPLPIDKLNKAWENLESTISLITVPGAGVGPTIECQIYTALAAVLAQIASMIHKGSELALVTPDVAPQDVAQQFNTLSGLVCGSVETLTDSVCSFITAESSSADPQVNNIVTNIYLQASEGNNYMQQCLKHLSTVLQYSNTKKVITTL